MLKQLSRLSNKEMGRLADWAFRIVGGSHLEGFRGINPFIHVSTDVMDGYVVIIVRPLLLAADMREDELRLFYHSFASRKYAELDRALSGIQDLSERGILLVGATDAGLAATYLALRLVRKHAVIAPLGRWINCHGQVQVITMNSPAPLTPGAIQVYRLPQGSMLDFALSPPNQDFTYAGILHLCKSPSMLPSISQVNNENSLVAYFQGQELSAFNIEAHFNSYLSQPPPSVLAKRLAMQQGKAQQGMVAASADFVFIGDLHHRQDLDSCANALQARLQQVLTSKLYQGNEFVAHHHLKSNWALDGQVICSHDNFAISPENTFEDRSVGFKVVCTFTNVRGTREFASYWLTIDPPMMEQDSIDHISDGANMAQEVDHADHQPLMDKPPAPSLKQADSFRRASFLQKPSSSMSGAATGRSRISEGLDGCIAALFEMQPELRIFSPYHKESTNIPLTFQVWPFEHRACRAKLAPSSALHSLYEESRDLYVVLMTSPAIPNPIECQRGTLPATISGEDMGHSAEYWPLFSLYVHNYLYSEAFAVEQLVTDYVFDKESDGAAFLKALFAILHSSLGRDIVANQYDCTRPEVLWHSSDFCPQMCRVLIDSNFCKRVYVADSGLKISLRGESSVHESLDDTKRQWEILFKMKKNFADRSTIILQLRASSKDKKYPGKLFYTAIFLEGDLHTLQAGNLVPREDRSK